MRTHSVDSLARLGFVAAFSVLALGALVPGSAWGFSQLTTLYNFCSEGGGSCTDGSGPLGTLVMDKEGRLFGTTYSGGAHGMGTVYELIPNKAKTAYQEKVLYTFCPLGGSCTDGANPYSGLAIDDDGNLYGVTDNGGAHAKGTVFQLSPNKSKSKYQHNVIYSFCAQGGANCTDGANPIMYGVPVLDAHGNVYGTTLAGGAHAGGTVFQLLSNKAHTAFTEKVLYSFCAVGGSSCTDGAGPYAGLVADAKGNLFGTAAGGGTIGEAGGVVFEMVHKGKATYTWKELYSLCVNGCPPDGFEPLGALAVDKVGHVFGTTFFNGAHSHGVVFALTPDNTKTPVTYSEGVIYAFCAVGSLCTDGAQPYGGLIADKAGNLYGTTSSGGGAAYATSGTVFELVINNTKTAYTEKVLYPFCSLGGSNCTDGTEPVSGLIMDKAGNLYGTTHNNGAHRAGTVFKVVP